MPNSLTSAGLTIKTTTEIVSDLVTALRGIYGSDINVDSNSPDGQMINIYGQASEDILELLLSVYNSFAVEKAFGVYLDQRVALNGLARRAGTYTETNVTVTTSSAVNLTGLDALDSDPTATVFTVSDGNGNQFYLKASVSIGSASDNILAFRAKDIGQIETSPNTITSQVTVVSGVSAVNNPSPATVTGINEETDAELKIRHAQSFYLASTGPADAVEAALQSVSGVTDAFVAENNTASPVASVPAYSIWCIVENGASLAIGTAIYNKKMPGCGMKGSVTQVISRPNGSSFTAKFDRPIETALNVEFTVASKVPGVSFDLTAMAIAVSEALVYKLNQSASIGDVILAVNNYEPRAVLSAVGVSSNGGSNYYDVVSPSDYQHKFTLSSAHVHISS